MFQVVTRVKLTPGSAEACAKLFRDTNPPLVNNQPDWLGAQMIVDRETDTITVLACWRKVESYRALSNSDTFRMTMSKFAQYFTGPPEVTIHEVLVQMSAEDVK